MCSACYLLSSDQFNNFRRNRIRASSCIVCGSPCNCRQVKHANHFRLLIAIGLVVGEMGCIRAANRDQLSGTDEVAGHRVPWSVALVYLNILSAPVESSKRGKRAGTFLHWNDGRLRTQTIETCQYPTKYFLQIRETTFVIVNSKTITSTIHVTMPC